MLNVEDVEEDENEEIVRTENYGRGKRMQFKSTRWSFMA